MIQPRCELVLLFNRQLIHEDQILIKTIRLTRVIMIGLIWGIRVRIMLLLMLLILAQSSDVWLGSLAALSRALLRHIDWVVVSCSMLVLSEVYLSHVIVQTIVKSLQAEQVICTGLAAIISSERDHGRIILTFIPILDLLIDSTNDALFIAVISNLIFRRSWRGLATSVEQINLIVCLLLKELLLDLICKLTHIWRLAL